MTLPPVRTTYREFKAEGNTRVCSLLLTAGFIWTMVVTGVLKALPKLL